MKFLGSLWVMAVLCLCMLLLGETVYGKTVYKWTDSQGEVHLTDYPPEQTEAQTAVEAIDEKDVERRIERFKGPAIPHGDRAGLGSAGWVPGTGGAGAAEMEKFLAGWFASPDMGLFQLMSAKMMTLAVAFVLSFHLFYSLALYLICRKLGVPQPWLAWIPTVNFVPTVRAAGLSLWWSLPLLVPLLSYIPGVITHPILVLLVFGVLLFDLVFFFVLWGRICGNLWISQWWSLMILLPPLFVILIGYLAFKDEPDERSVSRLRPALATLVLFAVLTTSSYVGLNKIVIPRMVNEMEQQFSNMDWSLPASEAAHQLLSHPQGAQH
ncbi:MAG: DUF4124 domain-containing protein [bacterium]|nr:DUF4124 domain-containing protein [bacterium]